MSVPYYPVPPVPRAPEGTTPSTVHFWMIIAIFGAQCIPAFICLFTFDVPDFFGSTLNPSDPFSMYGLMFTPAYLAVLVTSFLAYGATVVFAYFDVKELTAREVPSPFHWAWSFIPTYGSTVYVIGRSVVVYRRTRAGLAPLWVFIAINVISFIVSIVGTLVMMNSMMNAFSGLYGI